VRHSADQIGAAALDALPRLGAAHADNQPSPQGRVIASAEVLLK